MVDNGKGLDTESSAGVCTETSTETPFSMLAISFDLLYDIFYLHQSLYLVGTSDNFKTFSSEISGMIKVSPNNCNNALTLVSRYRYS